MIYPSRVLKNAAANLARGAAIASFSLLLPPFLVRHMPAATYTIWVLVLQLAAYVGYFDFGIQLALGRYIAYAHERRDLAQRDAMFSTSLLGLMAACICSCIALCLLLAFLPKFFPTVPGTLIHDMRWTLFIVGSTMALGLPASVCNGVFVGLQRNEIPAATTGGAKVLAAAGIIAAALAGYSLKTMATIVAGSSLLAYLVQFATMRTIAPDLVFKAKAVTRTAGRELFHYCLAITVMSVSMLLVSGFDVILVGRFEIKAVIAYSIAAGFIPIISGALYALLNAIMPHAAALHAQGARRALGNLVVSSTAFSVLVLILTALPAVIYAGPLLRFWIGPAFVPEARTIFIILLLANVIRLSGAAYSVVLVAAGQQQLIKVSPLAEGVGNLVVSVCLGAVYGAVGVAFGTLVGSIISIGTHFFYSIPQTRSEIAFARRKLLWSGIAAPVLCTSPLLVVAIYSGHRISPAYFGIALMLSVGASGHLLYRSRKAGAVINTFRERWS